MKNGLVIADAGPIFSLAIIDKLELLNLIFDEIKIPKAFLENDRYYSLKLLNILLERHNELKIKHKANN